MKTLLAVLALVPTFTFAANHDPIVNNETYTPHVYVLVNSEGKRLITNVKPFPAGYVIVQEYKDGAVLKKDDK